jgi:hypothetical protein
MSIAEIGAGVSRCVLCVFITLQYLGSTLAVWKRWKPGTRCNKICIGNHAAAAYAIVHDDTACGFPMAKKEEIECSEPICQLLFPKTSDYCQGEKSEGGRKKKSD